MNLAPLHTKCRYYHSINNLLRTDQTFDPRDSDGQRDFVKGPVPRKEELPFIGESRGRSCQGTRGGRFAEQVRDGGELPEPSIIRGPPEGVLRGRVWVLLCGCTEDPVRGRSVSVPRLSARDRRSFRSLHGDLRPPVEVSCREVVLP